MCKFCGGEPVSSCCDEGNESVHWVCCVYCNDCGARTPYQWGIEGEADESEPDDRARNLWNAGNQHKKEMI